MLDEKRTQLRKDVLKAELQEALSIFSRAAASNDIAFAIARSICNLVQARSVTLVAELKTETSKIKTVIGTYGLASVIDQFQISEIENQHEFEAFANSLGWLDLETEFVATTPFENGVIANLYCRKFESKKNLISGYVLIESATNPFQHEAFEHALLLASMGGLRLSQPDGRIGVQSLILQKIMHDLNGSLAVVSLQAELLHLKANIEDHFEDAKRRIDSALSKADNAVQQLNEFAYLFFPQNQTKSEDSETCIPLAAFKAAWLTLPLTSSQLERIHLENSLTLNDLVGVNRTILYWLYRAVFSLWVTPLLQIEENVSQIIIDLRKTQEEKQEIVFCVSREINQLVEPTIDRSMLFKPGLRDSKIYLVPPFAMLKETAALYGGRATIETIGSLRVLEVSFPAL